MDKLIELTGEDGAKFKVGIVRIKASGSTQESGKGRHYIVVENNQRLYCKEDFVQIDRLKKHCS